MKNKSKKSFVWFFAFLAALVGVVVAIGTYLKKKAAVISENLDYDGEIYDEDDDYYEDTPEDDIESIIGIAEPQDSTEDKAEE